MLGLGAVLLASFFLDPAPVDLPDATGFWSFYTADPLAIFFKRFALVTTIFVLVMMIDYAPVVRGIDSRRDPSGRSRRIFRAADFHLRRTDVDGVRGRFRHDLRLARAGDDVVLCAGQLSPGAIRRLWKPA